MCRRNVWSFCVAVVFISLFYSCEKIIDFKGDEFESKLVINSILSPDSIFKIHLSKSISVFEDDSILNVTDQQIEITKNSNQVETLSHGADGYYISENIIPMAGDQYTIRVINDNTEVSASTQIPDKVEILSIDTVFIKNRTTLEFYITLKDPIDIQNFYKISLMEIIKFDHSFEKSALIHDFVSNYKIINMEESSFLSSMGSMPDNQSIQELTFNKYYIFSDQLINGQIYTLKVATPFRIPSNAESYSISVELQLLNSDYFYYLKSKTLLDALSKNSFIEPVGIMSNITNGIGIFGALNTSQKSFVFTSKNE